MRSWKTTLGGALDLFGKALMGVGLLPALNGGVHSEVNYWIALVGFIVSAAGGFFQGLYARDVNVTSEQQGLVK